ERIFDIFEQTYVETPKDQNATRIPIADDLGEPEIQFLENAKIRTLKTLPQNSLYWGSELYHLHINRDHVFAKIPNCLEVQRIRNNKSEISELDSNGAKLARNPAESFILSPKTQHPGAKRLLGNDDIAKKLSFRIAQFLSSPLLSLSPAFTIDSHLG